MKTLINESQYRWIDEHADSKTEIQNGIINLDKIFVVLDLNSIKNGKEIINVNSNIDYDESAVYYGLPFVTESDEKEKQIHLFSNYTLARIYAGMIKNTNVNKAAFIGVLRQNEDHIEDMLQALYVLKKIDGFWFDEEYEFNLSEIKGMPNAKQFKQISGNKLNKYAKLRVEMSWYDELNFVGKTDINSYEEEWKELKENVFREELSEDEDVMNAAETIVKDILKYWKKTYVLMPNKMFRNVKKIEYKKLINKNGSLLVFFSEKEAEIFAENMDCTVFDVKQGDIIDIIANYMRETKNKKVIVGFEENKKNIVLSK